MKKVKKEVPENIKYLSDWKEFSDLFINKGHLILNKKITGCGATSYFLNHPDLRVILCSPRILLLEDKFKQSESYTHWFRNGDSSEEDLGEESYKVKKSKSLIEYKDDLRRYLVNSESPKILVTYDSLEYVLETLKEEGEDLNSYTVVVDEFHSIFQDCKFKPDTELNLLRTLNLIKNVIYLSATPILDEYLEQMDEFNELPYYELKWPEKRLIKATINKVKVNNLIEEAINIINSFKGGLYPTKTTNGEIIESKEAVLYFNSVKDIISILKKTKLTAGEVNILCAKTSDNIKKLKKIDDRKYTIGSIPKKGEEHKMFTFCTRTSFLGTDFYSTNASTYIFADPNIDSLSIDISMDLPQIIGRQRLESNPFRYDVTLFYKTIEVLDDIKKFQEKINSKITSTKDLIDTISLVTDSQRKALLIDRLVDSNITNRYSKDYLGFVNGSEARFNKLVYFSDLRSWKIQQMNFKDGYTLFNTLNEEGYQVLDKRIDENDYTNFYKSFTKTRSFEVRMKEYCNMVNKVGIDCIKLFSFIPIEYHNIYNNLGEERIKSLKYRKGDIEGHIKIKKKESIIYEMLKKKFKIGDRYSMTFIKDTLKSIYNSLDLDITAKATDIKKFFDIRRVKLSGNVAGFEICSHSINDSVRNGCSVFSRAFKVQAPQTTNVDDILNLIKTGSGGIKKSIEKIRLTSDHKVQNKLKYLNLPMVCWNGVFEKRNNGSLKEYS